MSFEHQTEMLSRLLEIAATSTVMNLMGTSQVNGRRFDNTSRTQDSTTAIVRNIASTSSPNGSDSNFQEFVSALRRGLLTNELSSRYNDLDSNERDNMTFFRAFRFDSENTTTGTDPTSNDNNDGWDVEEDLGGGPFSFGLHDRGDLEAESDDNSIFESGFGGHYHHHHDHDNDNLHQPDNTTRNDNNENNNDNDVESPNVPVMIIGVRSVQQNSSDALNTLATGTTNSTGSTTTTATSAAQTNEPGLATNMGSSAQQSPPLPSQQQQQQRSWVIFVMGNTFAWNHPLLSAPSLMSENPTYEDLLNLQELIGQVKPQVTTKEELYQHSDQLYEIVLNESGPTSTTTDFKSLKVDPFERCQICLSEYESHEIVRKLSSCNHFYHRDCVDNWLLNGKNNCPLCRSKGIVNNNTEDDEGKEVSGGTAAAATTSTSADHVDVS